MMPSSVRVANIYDIQNGVELDTSLGAQACCWMN